MTNYSQISLETKQEGMYNITGSLVRAVAESGIREGLCVAHCPHTTAGLTSMRMQIRMLPGICSWP